MNIFKEISATVLDIPVHLDDWSYNRKRDLHEVSARLAYKLPNSFLYLFPQSVMFRVLELTRQEADTEYGLLADEDF